MQLPIVHETKETAKRNYKKNQNSSSKKQKGKYKHHSHNQVIERTGMTPRL